MNDLETSERENPAERELARRLHGLAETTKVSPDAWDRVAARTVADSAASASTSASASGTSRASLGSRSAGFARRHARPLLATAAAVAVVIGLVIAQGGDGDDDNDNLETTDHSDRTTTTTTERESSRDRRSSTTPTSPTERSAPSVPSGGQPAPGPGAAPPAGSAGEGAGPSGGAAPAPGPGGGPEPNDPAPAPPVRATPTMTLGSSEYTVEIIADPEPGLYFRRTDGVGNGIAGPDAYGARSRSGWSSQSGPRCLTSGGGTVSYPDASPHAFTYGLVGSEIARVEVVMPGGGRHPASIGPGVGGGFRAWLVERPVGNEVQDIQGLDAAGNLVASIGQRVSDDYGYSTATC